MEAVDFHQAVARALSNNAFVSAAGEEAVSARRDADVARGYLLPPSGSRKKFVRTSVPAEAFGLKMNQEKLLATDFADVRNFNSPPPRNDFIAILSLEQPLFAPKAYIGYGMAKTEAAAKGQDLYRRKEDAVYRVLAAVLDVITARQFVEVEGQGSPTPGSTCGSRRASRRRGWDSPPMFCGRRWRSPRRKARR